jgi:pilus assembly protein Flp/PilA
MTIALAALSQFLQDDHGQDLIEYALLAGLIGLAAVVSIRALSGKVGNAFSNVGSQLSSAV